MCGIVGIYRAGGPTEADERSIENSLKVLRLRGPDGQGIHRDGEVILGHTRLAILDPKQGAQPWIDPGSGIALTYNGEIYNYPELRDILRSKGYAFRTNCDTELLMAAYLEWGEACLSRLEGMFAFAVVDPVKRILWMARDRLGVKPLYYAQGPEHLIFASSLPAIFSFSDVERRIDEVALRHYLMTIRTSIGNRTLVRGISTLLPGQSLRVGLDSGRIERNTYWELPVVAEGDKDPDADERAVLDEAHRLFDGAVTRQLISDVPLGGFLSGGIDSSILSGSIVRTMRAPLHGFSTGYRMDGYNEWEYVRETGALHGIQVEEVPLNEEDYAGDWRKLVGIKGLPLSTPNEVAIMRLAQAFGERFTVAMTGEGADEIFGGYVGPTFCAFDFDRFQGRHGGINPQTLQRAYGTKELGSRRDHFFRVNSWTGEAARRALLDDGDGKGMAANQEITDYYEGLFSRFAECTTLDAYLHVHSRVNLEGLLNRLDSSTMAASVEGRVPFTDHHFAEWAFRLPDTFKMGLGPGLQPEQLRHLSCFELESHGFIESKRLLRKAFGERVPERILNRRKMSFPVPFREWFNGKWKQPWLDCLNESGLLSEILRKEALEQLRKPDQEVNGMLAWPLMNLALMEEIWGIKA